jgi:hypothetical protein
VDADDWNVICEVQSAIQGGGNGTNNVAHFIKQGGGSGDGTTPISQPAVSPIDYPRPGGSFNPATDCDAPVTIDPDGAGPRHQYSFYDNCSIPNVTINGGDIGTSDVSPEMFFDVNTPSTGIAFTSADNSLIQAPKALAGLGFGVNVTLSLRDALQALQFPGGGPDGVHPCHPSSAQHGLVLPQTVTIDGKSVTLDVGQATTTASGVIKSASDGVATVADSEECMPNLTMAEVAGLVTQKIEDWTQFNSEQALDWVTDTNADGTIDLLEAAADAGVPIPTTNANPALDNRRPHFCRRNAGSGTNAQFQAFFLRRPCANIGGSIVADAAASTSPSSCVFNQPQGVVCMNRGSSDLGRCLDDLENATNTSTVFPDTNPINYPRFAWGIGYQSVEKNANLGRDYRFVKIDGKAPTLQNIWRADYRDHFEQTCQKRPGDDALDNDGIVPNGVYDAVFDNLCTAGPTDIFLENLSFLHPWGEAGWLVVPDDDGARPAGSSDPYTGTGSITEAPLSEAVLTDETILAGGALPIATHTRDGVACKAPKVVDSAPAIVPTPAPVP